MQIRKLGANGPEVSAIGLGCMSFAGFFGETDLAASHRCLDAAVDHGITFLDTANIYGDGRSEEVIGSWKHPKKSQMLIATKAGIVRYPSAGANNSPEHFRSELDASLKRLGVDHVALYYAHRRDPEVPPEELAGTMGDLIDTGKIGGYGLSEVAPYTLRRAHAERPCTAVQNEYSLWTRLPELGLIQATQELGVAFVPFSPLARGVLSEAPPKTAEMRAPDLRMQLPRFSDENYPRNLAAIEPFRAYAKERGVKTAALALAWVLDQGPHIIPIPGTRTADHLAEWAKATDITLTDDDRAEINRILPVGWAYGDRYAPQHIGIVERYC